MPVQIADIDIALEGITDAETYFALLGDAMDLTRLRSTSCSWKKLNRSSPS